MVAAVASPGRTGKVVELEENAMTTSKCRALALIALLLLPNVATSADAAMAMEACEILRPKGRRSEG